MKTIWTLLVLLCSWALLVESGTVQAKISIQQQLPQELVSDYAGMLTAEQKAELNAKLRAYYDKTTNVFVVVTIPSIEETGEATLQDWNMKLADTWKPGSSEKDNGLIMTISGKTPPFKVRINPGRGLTGSLTDAYLKRMVEDTMKPVLNAPTNYYSGINVAVDAMVTKVGDEFLKKGEQATETEAVEFLWVIGFLFCVIALMIIGSVSLLAALFVGALIGGIIGAFTIIGILWGIFWGVLVAFILGLIGKGMATMTTSGSYGGSYDGGGWSSGSSSGSDSSSGFSSGGGFDGGGAGD